MPRYDILKLNMMKVCEQKKENALTGQSNQKISRLRRANDQKDININYF